MHETTKLNIEKMNEKSRISDLRPYFREEDEMLSRTTSMQEGEDDEDINTLATIILSVEILGPII
jgi:hypothetical protein